MVANKQCLLLCCRFYGYLEITTGFGDSDRIWRCDFYFWRLRFYLEIEIELGDRYFATRDTWPLCATIKELQSGVIVHSGRTRGSSLQWYVILTTQ